MGCQNRAMGRDRTSQRTETRVYNPEWGVNCGANIEYQLEGAYYETTANLDDNQHMPLEDGERYFAQQENEVRRQQYQKKLFQQTSRTMKQVRLRLWSYRRYEPVGVALIIGAYAIWVGKNGGPDLSRYPLFGSLNNVVQRILRM